MNNLNSNLRISKDASELKLNDMSGTLTIEAALKQAKRNFNRLHGLQQIINELKGDENQNA